MSLIKKKNLSKSRRISRVRKRMKFADLERVSVFRSSKHIYAQVLDKKGEKTLTSSSSLFLKDTVKGDKKNIAKMVGVDLAKKLSEMDVLKVCFDRGGFSYHGRIRSLAEGLREVGINV